MKKTQKRQKTALASRSEGKAPAKSPAAKKTAARKPSAKTVRPSKKSPPPAKRSTQDPRVRSKQTKSTSVWDIWDSIASTIEAVPPQVRDAAWSILQDWMKPNADTDQAESVATSDTQVGEGLSICFFSPSLDDAKAFCDRLLGHNFVWADSRASGGNWIVSVSRHRSDIDHTDHSERALKSAVSNADLIVFAVDAGTEKLSRATISSCKQVWATSQATGVPMLVIMINSEELLPSRRAYFESPGVRDRWGAIMLKRETDLVNTLGCAREDAIVVSLPLERGMNTAAERMLKKLVDDKRILLLAAMSEELVPQRFKEASETFSSVVQDFTSTLYQGARDSLQYLFDNPEVGQTLLNLFRRKPLTQEDYECMAKHTMKAGKNVLYLKRVRAWINDILRTCDLAEI